MKRRSSASTQTTRLIFQRSTAGPSVSFFKLEDHDSLPDSDPESGLGPLASPVNRSKRVKVEIVNTEGTSSCGGDDEYLPGLATKTPMGKGNSKAARQPPARTPSSESAASLKKPKANKQALEKPRTCTLEGNVRRHQGDGSFRAALVGTLSPLGLLAAEEQAIADAIGKVGFRRKTQFVPTPPFCPLQK